MKKNIVIVLMLAVFVLFFAWSNYNYLGVLETNDGLLVRLVDSQERERELGVRCSELEAKYLAAVEEKSALSSEVVRLSGRKSLPDYAFSPDDVQLLALVALCEAGHGNVASQMNVVSVVLNRVESPLFPNTIREVVYQNDGGIPQFSVAHNGMMARESVTGEALQSVYEVLLFGRTLPEGVLYFYSAEFAECGWIRSLPKYAEVEGTVFAYEEGVER